MGVVWENVLGDWRHKSGTGAILGRPRCSFSDVPHAALMWLP